LPRKPSPPTPVLITKSTHHTTITMSKIAAIPCPHHECPYAFPHIKGVQSQIRQHLITIHTRTQNMQLNPTHLHKLNCFPCTHCHTIFASIDKQRQHTSKQHPSNCTTTNLDIVLATYPLHTRTTTQQTQIRSNWSNTLTWLQTLTITPPRHRHSIYHKLTATHKKTRLLYDPSHRTMV
jgi:hypothetical protein